jgi:hypothetical protein
MTKSLMPGLVYACGVLLGVDRFSLASAANMGRAWVVAGGRGGRGGMVVVVTAAVVRGCSVTAWLCGRAPVAVDAQEQSVGWGLRGCLWAAPAAAFKP